MTTAAAPAMVAFLAFSAKPQSPRSMRAIFPTTAPAFEKGEQPSVDGPPASTASTTATTPEVTDGLPTAGPNAALPNWYAPAIVAGLVTFTSGLPNDSTAGRSAVTCAPS